MAYPLTWGYCKCYDMGTPVTCNRRSPRAHKVLVSYAHMEILDARRTSPGKWQSTPARTPCTESTYRAVQHLKYQNPYQTHKTLGHYKEPAGTQSTQFTKLTEKSTQITMFLWTTALSREETHVVVLQCLLFSRSAVPIDLVTLQ